MFFQIRRSAAFFILVNILFQNAIFAQPAKSKKYVVNGYVSGLRSTPIDISVIDATKLTHINYAFVNCVDSMAVLINPKTDLLIFTF